MNSILETMLWVILAISPIAVLVAFRMIFSKAEEKQPPRPKQLPPIPYIPQTYSRPTSSYKPVRTNYIPPSSTLHRVPDGYSDFVDTFITYSVISSSLVDKEEGTSCTTNNEDNYKQTEDSCSSNTYDNDCSYSDSSSDSSSCSSD